MSSPFEDAPFDDEPDYVRVFPLPNVVLFPHVLLPLHIFEPRYIAMVEEALDGDRTIAMAQLKPGWETRNPDHPEFFQVVCLGHIAHHVRLQDGNYNIVLQGTQRATVISELPLEVPFRRVQVEILEETRDLDFESHEDALRAELLRGFRKLFPKLDVEHDLHHVFESDIPLGVLCDVFAYSLQLDSLVAQRLLEEANVERRSQQLLSLMEQQLTRKPPETPRDFPPQFSLN